jgi:hypothetical protein
VSWTNDWKPGTECRVRWRSGWKSATVFCSATNHMVVEVSVGSSRFAVTVNDPRNITLPADAPKAARAAHRRARLLAEAERVQLALDVEGVTARPLKARRRT